MRDYEAGIVTPDSVAWLRNLAGKDRGPAGIVHQDLYHSGRATAGGGVCVTANGRAAFCTTKPEAPLRLLVRFRTDLRWMWPYDANALGDLHYAFDKGLQALHVRDTTKSFYCVMGADCGPESELSGQFSSIEMTSSGIAGKPLPRSTRCSMRPSTNSVPQNAFVLNYAIVGTNEGQKKAVEDYRALLENPAGALLEVVGHYQRLLSTMVTFTSPDVEFNRLFTWAIVGTDRFVAHTPGIGTGLLAGFGTTARGWDGAQKISGRPGYAWYFGRDAEWSGFAMDDYGDCETVREQLRLLQSYQDRYGKIFHEISTSGSVHFDAADATPLYIMLAGHYLRASGDVAFIRKSWPNLKNAMDFLYSTDTDGDGLIENTNVGHGWLEPGGPLFGSHSSFYLSALWAQTLTEHGVHGRSARQEGGCCSIFRRCPAGREDREQGFLERQHRILQLRQEQRWNLQAGTDSSAGGGCLSQSSGRRPGCLHPAGLRGEWVHVRLGSPDPEFPISLLQSEGIPLWEHLAAVHRVDGTCGV